MNFVLTFHSIDASGSVLSFPPDEFRRLVEGLLEEGADIVGLDDLIASSRAGEKHRVALTFDDGMTTVHREALPILAQYDVPAICYVVTNFVGRDNRWPGQPATAPVFELMSWNALRELRDAGIDLGSHTANHVAIDQEMGSVAESELNDSRALMEDELQQDVRHFAYPYGSYDTGDPARVANYYSTAVTTDMGSVKADVNHFLVPRVDAYYLRGSRRHIPLFGHRMRAYLGLRAFLRGLRSGVMR